MEDICLDTDVLVDFLRNKEYAVAYIEANELTSKLATTYVNLFELYYGAMKSSNAEKNLKAVDILKERLTLFNLSEHSVKDAAKILANLEKKGGAIDFRDLFIGTIALRNGFKIRTNNVKHFSKIEGLEIV